MHKLVPTKVMMLGMVLGWMVWDSAIRAGVDFSSQILPILSDKCFQCHGPDAQQRKADLRLDVAESVLSSHRNPPVAVPHKSQESELYRRLVSQDPDEVMPPPSSNKNVSIQEINLIRQWIDEGVQWGEHWAFTPIRRNAPPSDSSGWSQNPIDAFIRDRLRREGLSPSPPAPSERLFRRLSLDLRGFPPSEAEFLEFQNESPEGQFERWIRRWLNSPHFGERMAWDWLDAARYADSNGYQGDRERTMWPWRDWVVNALNRNLSWKDFTLQQLAGDLLPDSDAEAVLATGFNRNHMINGEGGRIAEENRVDYVMDMSETMGTVWLGLTLNCCRCHDHKFDPLTQKEYYQFFAFFNQTPVNGGGGDPQTPPILPWPSPRQDQNQKYLAKNLETFLTRIQKEEQDDGLLSQVENPTEEILGLIKKAPAQRSKEDWQKLRETFSETTPEYIQTLDAVLKSKEELQSLERSIPKVMVMREMDEPRQTFRLGRGLYNQPEEPVLPGVPQSLPPLESSGTPDRLDLARWLVSSSNPLPARVLMNRLWAQFFGMGLVKTMEDFGRQGERPSHPELLDWLAREWIDSDWDLKHMVTLLVSSATYQQDSVFREDLMERDPENRLYARGPRYRMPSWMIRDQALVVSGLWVPQVGGPPVFPYQPAGVWADVTFGNKRYQQDQGANLYRRSLYTFWRRIIAPTSFFDVASRQTCTVKALRTNSPLHALALFNDETYIEAARGLANRVLLDPEVEKDSARLIRIYRLLLTREPVRAELEIGMKRLQALREDFSAAPDLADAVLKNGRLSPLTSISRIEQAAWSALCLTLLNLDETITKE